MPRPSSSTLTEPSVCSVTAMRLPKPASASSAALSITSWMMCSGLSVRVYMPGRCLTGSRPFSTRIEASPYVRCRSCLRFACHGRRILGARPKGLAPLDREARSAQCAQTRGAASSEASMCSCGLPLQPPFSTVRCAARQRRWRLQRHRCGRGARTSSAAVRPSSSVCCDQHGLSAHPCHAVVHGAQRCGLEDVGHAHDGAGSHGETAACRPAAHRSRCRRRASVRWAIRQAGDRDCRRRSRTKRSTPASTRCTRQQRPLARPRWLEDLKMSSHAPLPFRRLSTRTSLCCPHRTEQPRVRVMPTSRCATC